MDQCWFIDNWPPGQLSWIKKCLLRECIWKIHLQHVCHLVQSSVFCCQHDSWTQRTNSLSFDQNAYHLNEPDLWCPVVPSHYLNQCWLTFNKVLWHSLSGNIYFNTQDIHPQVMFQIYTSNSHFIVIIRKLFTILSVVSKHKALWFWWSYEPGAKKGTNRALSQYKDRLSQVWGFPC